MQILPRSRRPTTIKTRGFRGTAVGLLRFKRRSYAPVSGSVLPFPVFRITRSLDRGLGRASFGGRSSSLTVDLRGYCADHTFRPASKDDLKVSWEQKSNSDRARARITVGDV
jgi:hypothetical protein